jgi:hypothetical protein
MVVAMVALGAAPAQAQMNVGVGGAGIFSLEDGGGSDFGAMAKIGFGAGDVGIGGRVDATFIFDDADGTGILFGLGPTYTFRTSETSMFKPYLVAEGTLLTNTNGFTDNIGDKLGVSAGAGFNFQVSSVNLFAEGLFNNTFADPESFQFIRAHVGVGFAIGGSAN